MKSKTFAFLCIVFLGTLMLANFASAQIVGTKHDLSVTGGGNWTGNDPSNQVCIYCHTPHAASASQKPLWNRNASSQTFTAYSSSTFQGTFADAATHQPQGESKLCLSCHDGVTALNSMLYNYGPSIQMVGGFDQLGQVYYPGSPFMPDHRGLGANIGENYPGGSGAGVNNLANDHPISFGFDNALVLADGGLRLPAAGSAVKLYGASHDQLECSSCHDVHSNAIAPFLVMSNSGSALCLTCHIK